MPANDDTFLGRWSRRKQETAKEARQPKPAPATDAVDDDVALDDQPDAELTDSEILEQLGLPDPDDLKMGDDFKRYLTKAVPQRIRQRALRKLWLSNPVLANLDGLNDYEQDFTDAATMAKGVATSYEVGRGFAKRLVDIVEDEPDVSGDEAAPDEPVAALAETAEDTPVTYQPAPQDESEETLAEPVRAPRRMAFSFDGDKS